MKFIQYDIRGKSITCCETHQVYISNVCQIFSSVSREMNDAMQQQQYSSTKDTSTARNMTSGREVRQNMGSVPQEHRAHIPHRHHQPQGENLKSKRTLDPQLIQKQVI